jgi:hypothetical protein
MAKYEVIVRIHWYRGLGYRDADNQWRKTEDNSFVEGDEYCRVIVEADGEWEARHAGFSPAADHYRHIFEEAYCGSDPRDVGPPRLADDTAVVGTVTELGPRSPFI